MSKQWNGNSGTPIKFRTHAPRQTQAQITQTRKPRNPLDFETDEGLVPVKTGSSAIRYVDREGHEVFQQGNKRLVFHAEEPPPTPQRRVHWMLIAGLSIMAVVLFISFVSWLGNWWTEHTLDTTYEFPRISQSDAVVYPGDTSDHPSHYLFLNLQGTVLIVEFPHGDSAKAKIYKGPTLFSDTAASVPVTGEFRVVNGKVEMLVHIQDKIILYVNDGTQFKPV